MTITAWESAKEEVNAMSIQQLAAFAAEYVPVTADSISNKEITKAELRDAYIRAAELGRHRGMKGDFVKARILDYLSKA